MKFNIVNTCPLKISLFGTTVRSTQLVNAGWCKSLTVALGSSVVQFISIFKPRKASNTWAGGLTNSSASMPTVKQMTISTHTNSVMIIRGWSVVKIFQVILAAYKSNEDMRQFWSKEKVTPKTVYFCPH